MSGPDPARILQGELAEGLKALARLEEFLVAYDRDVIQAGACGTEQALALTQALGNYYTCLETMFFRISQFFENSLPPARWHQELLDRMVMEIPETRPSVISASTREALSELLRFRHFSRYYYATDYDWDKLRFLLVKFHAVREPVRHEMDRFTARLGRLGS